MDSTTLSADKLELATLTRDEATGKVVFRIFEEAQMKQLLDEVNKEAEEERQRKEAKEREAAKK